MTRRAALLSVFATLALPPATVAQARTDSIAFAGGAGVYIWLGGTVVSRAHPVDGTVAHRVERRRDGTGEWRRVADLAAVESAREFFAPLDTVTRALLRHLFARHDDAGVWDYIVRFPRADSLAVLLGDETIRLALGFYALDRGVRPGERWQYRITDLDGEGRPGRTITSTVVAFPAHPTIDTVRALRVEDGERRARVWWDLRRGRNIRLVEVWRRRGTVGAFRPVDTLTVVMRVGDSLQTLYEDEAVQPGTAFQYFVRPYDFFFNPGPASDTVTAYGVAAYRLAVPDSLSARGIDSLGIELAWRLPTIGLARAVRVYRSLAQDTGWYRLADLAGDARRFLDERVEPMRLYYYRLAVLGLRGEESPTTGAVFAFVRARVPPLPPTAVIAEAAARGSGVRVRWAPNAEPDVRGYFVYRTDVPLDTVTTRTPLQLVSALVTDTQFVDTLPLAPGRQYTYAVRVVNTSNLSSGFSNPAPAPAGAGAALPALPAPAGLTVTVTGTRVRLLWDDATALVPTVAGYRVLRRSLGDADTTHRPLSAAPIAVNALWDSTVTRGTGYEYVVRVVDVAGSVGPASLPVRVTLPRAVPVAPPNVRAAVATDGVRLTWGAIVGVAARVRIYRYERGAPPQRMAEVAAEPAAYLDNGARSGVRYYYYLTLVVAGMEGERSPEVTARR